MRVENAASMVFVSAFMRKEFDWISRSQRRRSDEIWPEKEHG
jgi:hypothetical protein